MAQRLWWHTMAPLCRSPLLVFYRPVRCNTANMYKIVVDQPPHRVSFRSIFFIPQCSNTVLFPPCWDVSGICMWDNKNNNNNNVTTISKAQFKGTVRTNAKDTVHAAMKKHSQILDANRNVFRAVVHFITVKLWASTVHCAFDHKHNCCWLCVQDSMESHGLSHRDWSCSGGNIRACWAIDCCK